MIRQSATSFHCCNLIDIIIDKEYGFYGTCIVVHSKFFSKQYLEKFNFTPSQMQKNSIDVVFFFFKWNLI